MVSYILYPCQTQKLKSLLTISRPIGQQQPIQAIYAISTAESVCVLISNPMDPAHYPKQTNKQNLRIASFTL